MHKALRVCFANIGFLITPKPEPKNLFLDIKTKFKVTIMDHYTHLSIHYDLLQPKEEIFQQEYFFKKLMEKYSIKTCLDCACGTGWHLFIEHLFSKSECSKVEYFGNYDFEEYSIERSKRMIAIA